MCLRPCVSLLACLLLAAPALAQDGVAPVTSTQALLDRAHTFGQADRHFNLMRLELGRAQERLQLATEAANKFMEGKTREGLKGDPALQRQAELLALEVQAAQEAYEALGTGAGRARFVSLRDQLARGFGELMDELQRAIDVDDDPRLRLARGELLVGKGRFDDARRDAEVAIRARPQDPRALGLLAMCLVTDNRLDDAAALFEQACALEPTDERRAYQAIALYCLNRFAEARAARDQIAKPKELPASLQVRCAWWLTDGELDRATAAWAREEVLRAEEAKRDDLPRVELVTTRGAIVLELFEDTVPNAVAGLIELVEAGFYDGLPWHRVVPNLLAQTGDPAEREGAAPGARHDPGWRLKDDPLVRDPARARGHFRGTASLVCEDAPHTAGSQLFITVMPSSTFDGHHIGVGRVISGQSVVDQLREGDRVERARVVRKRPHLYKAGKAP